MLVGGGIPGDEVIQIVEGRQVEAHQHACHTLQDAVHPLSTLLSNPGHSMAYTGRSLLPQ